MPVYPLATRGVSLRVFCLLTLGCFAAPVSKADDGGVVWFDIPEQRADIALTSFAQQAGLPVLFPYDTVSRVNAKPLCGEYRIDDGLKILLAGTGLEAVTGGSQITVRRVPDEKESDEMTKRRGLLGTLLAALTSMAGAQEPAAEATGTSAIQEVTVTGSRIEQTTGMSTPTPVTSMSLDELAKLAPTTLADALQQLPQFLQNASAATVGAGWTGTAGASILNLRGVGASRTLVLLDGRRVVPSTRNGTIDVNLFPEALVRRVDVVTGGASAAYGSDAVSGVVNFVLDTDFVGLKGDFQGGMTGESDNKDVEASLSWGRALGERGHIIASADYYNASGVESYAERDWFQSWGRIANPSPTGPRQLIVPNVHSREFTYGGYIPRGPLAGTEFLAGGVPSTVAPGDIIARNAQSGGGGIDGGVDTWLMPATNRATAFTHVTYDVTDNLTAFVQALYGKSGASYDTQGAAMFGNWEATIFRDNAFLDESIRQRMFDLDIPSFPFGRLSSKADLGAPRVETDNDMISVTAGFKGGDPGGWRYNAYYQYGRNRQMLTLHHANRVDRLYRALDVVADPDTGAPVCRSTLSFPDDGCVPLNLFGPGSASREAIEWIQDDSWRDQLVEQHSAEVVLQGQPFSTWAGPVAVATGAAYRQDSLDQTAGPDDLEAMTVPPDESQGYDGLPDAYENARIFERGNPTPVAGKYDVWEVFGEAIVPLATDTRFARSLNLNAAVRHANYEGSGGIWAWKAGLDWQPLTDLRLRGTVSRDIRAGTLSERFDISRGGSSVIDPLSGSDESYAMTALTGGNPNIKPEEADTVTVGAIYQPSWLDGFAVSVDWYDIDISGAIATIGVQNIVDNCFAGVESNCALIIRNPETGLITEVINTFQNIDGARTRGVDVEATYATPVSFFGRNERLTVRAFAGFVHELSTTQAGAAPIDRAGQTGLGGGAPDWQGMLTATYRIGPVSTSVTHRYISSGTYDARWDEDDININRVSSAAYTNLRVSYHFDFMEGAGEIFANVNNAFDRDPPLAPTWGFTGSTHSNFALFDKMGRRYTVGLRFDF
ncbi:MAG: TonB-dependent receptor [Steroidobacteraceae bacterium]|nr:TonB-dependent receptor [Steroidobacteraceae bacterium]